MKKLVAVLFGLLVVAAGFAAATQWRVTSVRDSTSGKYGWAYAEVGVKYDVQHPYTNYEITYRYGDGDLINKLDPYSYGVYKYPDSTGITVKTVVLAPDAPETVVASAHWPAH
ncbi:MAG: hypothetical protein PWQ79_447 [Thermococcaceae archaeon]|nr:hypothetical protein [Thermococcaceae archaeon]MDK2913532.1 hypothetical protein [Thermococcaceae archaeon]